MCFRKRWATKCGISNCAWIYCWQWVFMLAGAPSVAQHHLKWKMRNSMTSNIWDPAQITFHLPWQFSHSTTVTDVRCMIFIIKHQRLLWTDRVWFQLVTHHHRSEAAALARELGETSGESGEENYVAPLIRARVVNFASPLPLKNLKANYYGKATQVSGTLSPPAAAASIRTWKIIKENRMRLFYSYSFGLLYQRRNVWVICRWFWWLQSVFRCCILELGKWSAEGISPES